MEFQEFISKFAEQFEETDASAFAADTEFKQLDEWSSMMALSIIAMVDEEYDIRIKGDDLRASDTIADLFEIVKSRKNV
ncbi:acyl carrier protein [Bacteroides sp. GD17]|jgi:acyl carrier protein|uniref:acyl carrier protein n=1 Tax=Bacteroides sp. GD17 TaxID=3139826 RepID=UPI0025F14FD5|nr:acyl carrier protein [uncultured Bacteroides sp.]